MNEPKNEVSAKAYLIMALRVDNRRPVVESIDLYSEPSPTQNLVNTRLFIVATGYGLDYASAVKNLRVQITSDPMAYAWMRPVLSDYARAHVFPDRATRRRA